MNPCKKTTSNRRTENRAIRPLKTINNTDGAEPEKDEERRNADEAESEKDEECGTCGEGLEDHQAGIRESVPVPTPYKPSQDEVDDHNLKHLPYRSWCRH